MTPVIVLYRVSSGEQEQAGYSLPTQRGETQTFCEREGFTIEEAVSFAESAKTVGRKAIDAVYRALDRHPAVRHVMVHRLDRWARNLSDFAELTERRGIKLISVREGFDDSPAGRLQQGILVVASKYDSELKAERVVDGMQKKVAETGGYPGKAPPGYRNVPRTKTQKARIEVDADKASLVREAFAQYATGYCSYQDISEELAASGIRTRLGNPLSLEMVRRILSNPFYVGRVRYKGQLYAGAHEPLIDPQFFARVQQVMSERSGGHQTKGRHVFLLRGLLHCSTCGRMLTAEVHARGGYYRCISDVRKPRCPEPYLPIVEADRHVEGILGNLVIDANHQARILSALDGLVHERTRLRERDEQGLRKQAEAVRAKRLALIDRLAGGAFSDEEFRTVMSRYEAELRELDRRLDFLARDLAADVATVKARLAQVSALPDLYRRCRDVDQRRQFLGSVFHRIVVHGRTIQGIEYQPPFHLLLPGEHVQGSMNVQDDLLSYLEGEGSQSAPGFRAAGR